MKKDFSFGIIPLRKVGDQWEIFLIRHKSGYWSFPKGHPEVDETPQATAARELYEETHLSVVRFLSTHKFSESYCFKFQGKLIYKTVGYFIAEVQGDAKLQLEEVIEGKWVLLEQAHHELTFAKTKQVYRAALKLLALT